MEGELKRDNVSDNPSRGPKKRGKPGCGKGSIWCLVVIEQHLYSQGVNMIHG